jgi:hypothetical protein
MKETKGKATTGNENAENEKQQSEKEKTGVPGKKGKNDAKNRVSRHPTTEPNPEG